VSEDWRGVPVFGVRPERKPCSIRPSAYGIIEDARDRLALVRTVEGIFLPGGGIESGETAKGAVVREALEECGLIVRVGTWSVRAVRFSYSEPEKTHFEKRCTFFEADVDGARAGGQEPDHELVWIETGLAARSLSDESHGWAVERWKARR
jgi:8-oxo-dGTP pyrophosphatase MutT (NUDIX family)